MAGFIEEVDRGQQSLLPGSLDGWVHKDNSVRVIDTFDDWSRGDRRVNPVPRRCEIRAMRTHLTVAALCLLGSADCLPPAEPAAGGWQCAPFRYRLSGVSTWRG
jgi:hypothetical protein